MKKVLIIFIGLIVTFSISFAEISDLGNFLNKKDVLITTQYKDAIKLTNMQGNKCIITPMICFDLEHPNEKVMGANFDIFQISPTIGGGTAKVDLKELELILKFVPTLIEQSSEQQTIEIKTKENLVLGFNANTKRYFLATQTLKYSGIFNFDSINHFQDFKNHIDEIIKVLNSSK